MRCCQRRPASVSAPWAGRSTVVEETESTIVRQWTDVRRLAGGWSRALEDNERSTARRGSVDAVERHGYRRIRSARAEVARDKAGRERQQRGPQQQGEVEKQQHPIG